MTDRIDQQLVDLLQADGRLPNAELARRVGLAPATTLERVRRLEQRGVIRRYAALVDPAAVGQGTIVLVAVTLAEHRAEAVQAFRDAVRAVPAVLECYHVSGEADYLLKVVAPTIAAYEHILLNTLTALPNVGRLRSSFVLSTVKHDTVIPLASEVSP